MEQHANESAVRRLDALIGEWEMVADIEGAPPTDAAARVVFEWMPGQRFVIQRWEVPGLDPVDMPATGIAIIGADPERPGQLVQHYFDSRGVARLYRMTLDDDVWRLWRDSSDVSPLDFAQRYTGSFSDDGEAVSGAWEICHDGVTWEHDF